MALDLKLFVAFGAFDFVLFDSASLSQMFVAYGVIAW
jgi:hypothetical protein